MASINFPISQAAQCVTIHVTGLRVFGIRLRVASWCFRLGARIAGVGIVLETTKEDDEWRTFKRDDSFSFVDQVNKEISDGARLRL